MNASLFLARLLAAGAIGLATGDLVAGCGQPVPGLIGVACAAAGLALSVLSRPRTASRSHP